MYDERRVKEYITELENALIDLVGVINEDKHGGYFICEEARGVVEAAIDLTEEAAK